MSRAIAAAKPSTESVVVVGLQPTRQKRKQRRPTALSARAAGTIRKDLRREQCKSFRLSHADGGEAGFLRTREPDDVLEPLSSLRFSLLCPGAGSTGSNAQPVDEDVDKS